MLSGLLFFVSMIPGCEKKEERKAVEVDMQVELQQALDSTFAQFEINGASAAVYIPGKGIWTGVSGISHHDVPIMPESVFGIGSVTKTFTAVIVLQLVEEGKLRVDDSLKRWLPDFPNIDSHITIAQLLNHTSGVFNFSMHPDFDSLLQVDLTRFWTPEETIMTFISTPYCLPGGGYNYSNTNYCLLGMIIKEVTGLTISAELRRRILTPLGLNRTFLPVEEIVSGDIAHPWLDIDDDGQFEDCFDVPITAAYSIGWTAGAIQSSARDLAVFSNALLAEKNLLSQSTLDKMLDFYPVNDLGYGYGISITEDFVPGVRGIGHDGHIYGYSARMVYIPSTGASIAVLVNDENGYDCKAAISRALARVVLEKQCQEQAFITPLHIRSLKNEMSFIRSF